MKQILNNIKKNLIIKNLLSDAPSRIFIASSCYIIYCFSVDKSIDNTILIIFLLTFGVTIQSLSKEKYTQFLESEDS